MGAVAAASFPWMRGAVSAPPFSTSSRGRLALNRGSIRCTLVSGWCPFVLLAAATQAHAQSVPSPEQSLGYALGERFTDAASVARYAETLAAASPRVSLVRYGETAEGRPLLLLVIASEDHATRVERILQANARLTNPDLASGDASAIAGTNPAVAWFTYGIHGDESSSTEAALWTAWDLAVGSEGAEGILDSLVVVIDPMANPDGRDRYVQWYRGTRGARPNPNAASREHDPPWPGGATTTTCSI